MEWSSFLYLAPTALVAILALVAVIRLAPALSVPSRSRTRAELALLGLVLAIGLVALYGNFYLENSAFAYYFGDIGTDTFEQYVPFYSNLIENVRDGTLSVWNFEYGLGVNAPGYQSWFFDPFNLIVVPLGLLLGESHLSLILVVSQSVKLVLSAYLFDHFLTRYCETPLSRLLGSLVFSFGGFMVLYGQHYWFGGALPLFALTMLMFELYLERRTVPRFLGVTASVALLVLWTVYVAFMVLLFAALYLLLRIPHYLERPSVRRYLAQVLWLAAPVACGMLLAGVTLVPYALFLLTETSRTSSADPLAQRVLTALTSFIDLSWVPAVLSRFLGSGLINTGANPDTPAVPGVGEIGGFTYEFILLGYSCGCFILLGQFFHWVATETGRRTKCLVGGATLLVLLYCFHQFLPTLFTAMVRLQYRSSFVIALPVCTAMAVGFEKRVVCGKVARAPLAASVALSLLVVVWSLVNTVNGRLVCLCYLAALVALCIVLALPAGPRVGRPVLAALVAALVVGTSVVDGFFTTNSRKLVPEEYFPLSGRSEVGEDTEAALQWIREHDDTFYRVDKTYAEWCPLNDSLVQHYDGASAYNSTMDSDVEEFYDKLWESSVSTWAVYSQGTINSPDSPEVLAFLNVKYLLSMTELPYDWCTLETQVGDVYVYRNTRAGSIATVTDRVYGETYANSLATSEERAALLADAVIFPDEIASTMASLPASTSEPTSQFWKRSETLVEGTIKCTERSAVCVAIPNTGTWEVKVDGQQMETIRANYGFIAFPVEAGTHEVTLAYHLAGLETGCLFSAAGALATGIGCLLIYRANRGEERVRRHAE